MSNIRNPFRGWLSGHPLFHGKLIRHPVVWLVVIAVGVVILNAVSIRQARNNPDAAFQTMLSRMMRTHSAKITTDFRYPNGTFYIVSDFNLERLAEEEGRATVRSSATNETSSLVYEADVVNVRDGAFGKLNDFAWSFQSEAGPGSVDARPLVNQWVSLPPDAELQNIDPPSQLEPFFVAYSLNQLLTGPFALGNFSEPNRVQLLDYITDNNLYEQQQPARAVEHNSQEAFEYRIKLSSKKLQRFTRMTAEMRGVDVGPEPQTLGDEFPDQSFLLDVWVDRNEQRLLGFQVVDESGSGSQESFWYGNFNRTLTIDAPKADLTLEEYRERAKSVQAP